MANQTDLQWGSLKLVTVYSSAGGYLLQNYTSSRPDYEEVSYPNTTGRRRIVRSIAGTASSSRSWTFFCQAYFTSFSAVTTWMDDIESASKSVALKTLIYSLYNSGSSETIQNTSLENFEISDIWIPDDSEWFVEFSVTFSEWL